MMMPTQLSTGRPRTGVRGTDRKIGVIWCALTQAPPESTKAMPR